MQRFAYVSLVLLTSINAVAVEDIYAPQFEKNQSEIQALSTLFVVSSCPPPEGIKVCGLISNDSKMKEDIFKEIVKQRYSHADFDELALWCKDKKNNCHRHTIVELHLLNSHNHALVQKMDKLNNEQKDLLEAMGAESKYNTALAEKAERKRAALKAFNESFNRNQVNCTSYLTGNMIQTNCH